MLIIKLLLRNAFRARLRTMLTITGIAVAILAFGLLRTVVAAWYAGVEASSASRLVTRNAISLIFPLPISYKDRIRQIEGVKTVSYGTWFGGVYKEEKNFFPNLAVEMQSFLEVYPEFLLSDDEHKAILKDRKGFIAGQKLVERFGWKPGDTVTLKGMIFPGEWDFVLRGVYRGRDRTVDESQFLFHWDYLNEKTKNKIPSSANYVGFYMIDIVRPDLAAQIALAVDSTFRNSLAETLTETEKAFQMSFVSMTEAIVMAVELVSFVVIAVIMAVVANTMAMTTRERIGEYAVMKTFGYGGRQIWALILGESLVITLLGGVLGIVLTYPAAALFGHKMSNFFPVFHVEIQTVYLDLAAAVFIGIVAAVIPGRRAVRIRIADGLRRIG